MNRRTALAALISSFSSVCMSRSRSERANPQAEGLQKSTRYALKKFTVPFYPPLARQINLEGKATVLAHISVDGRVSSVTHVDSHPLFHAAVVEAVEKWEFEAPDHQGEPLPVTIQFTLKGNRDERILNYKVSGALPDYFKIEANPFPNLNS